MTYEKAMEFLEYTNQYGSILGLDSMKSLLKRLGNPEEQLKFVHIAGTNGKGSTAAFIASMLAEAGYLVGRYISPSVFEYREKIQITGRKTIHNKQAEITTEYVSEKEVTEGISQIKVVCETLLSDGKPHPTTFEIETALAMLHFVKKGCDIVVLEVGLGGRLDATNVINTTECAVITSLSMDHMQFLGHTLQEIAAEKAGIIKPGIPVVSYQQQKDAQKVINSVCDQNNAELTITDFSKLTIDKFELQGTTFSYKDLNNLQIQMLGENQVKNAMIAIDAIKALQNKGYRILEEDIRNGLYHAKWKGRLEIVSNQPLFLIDGAHNEDAALSLAKNIKLYFSKKRIIYIMGILADKDYEAIVRHTGTYAERIITITPNNSRGLPAEELAHAAEKYCSKVINAGKVPDAIHKAFEAAEQEDVIIAFGSLSYLKEIYDYFGITK